MTNKPNSIVRYLDERFDIRGLIQFAKEKKVPVHRETVWYYFGGVALFLFVIQIVTGLLLLIYYRGTPEGAYESIRFIMSDVKFGWLIRSMHSWGANLMVFAVFIHMFSVFFKRTYRKPRELTWVSGFLLLALGLGLGFTGYLLPWNKLSFFATKVGTDIVGVLPVAGGFVMRLLRGGEDVTGATLTRFFGIHVTLLPMIFLVVLSLHLLFVQRQGMGEPLHVQARPGAKMKTMPFFPNFFLRDLLLWLIVLNVLSILAVFFPWELGVKADPFAPAPPGIKPEWYFMFMFQTLRLIPAKILFMDGEVVGIVGFAVAGLLWMAVPFWDRRSSKGLRNRKLTYLGIVVVAYILVMTIWGYFFD
jgi:cytochrome b6